MNTILRNGFINFLSLLVPAILMIVSMPLLTRWLGIETFGLWLICSTLLGLFGLLDFGLKETAITFIPKFLARNDAEGLESHIRSLFFLNLVIGLCSSILLFGVAKYAAIDVFGVSPDNAADTISAFRILAVGILPSLAINILSAIAMGYQQFHLSSALIVGRNILTTLGTLCFAALTGHLAPVIVFSVCASWFFLVVGLIGLHRVIPMRELFRLPSFEDFREVFSFGSLSFLANLSLLAMGVFDKIFIGALLGPMAVAFYSVPLSLVAKLEQVLVKFAQAILPRFSEVSAQGDGVSGGRNNIYDLSFSATVFISIGLGVGLIVLSEPLLTLWMGVDFCENSVWILRGLVLGYMFKMFNVVPSFILYSMRMPAKIAIAYSISGITYLLIIVFCAKYISLGFLSFASLSYAISFIILYLGIRVKLSKTLQWHAIPFLIASLLTYGLTYLMIDWLQVGDVLSILVGVITFSSIYVGSSFLLSQHIHPSKEYYEVNSLLVFGRKFLINFKSFVCSSGN